MLSRTPLRRNHGRATATGSARSVLPQTHSQNDNRDYQPVHDGEFIYFKNSKQNNKHGGKDSIVGIKLSDLREKLEKMRNIHDKNILDLDSEEKKIYDELVMYIGMLAGHYEPYKCYYDNVLKAFEDVPRNKIKPGTVGSFFIGCSLKQSENDNCDAFCAGSMPVPRNSKEESEFIPCAFPVLLANYRPNGVVDFIEIMNSGDKSKTIIWVDSNENFSGFTVLEKKYLERYGAKEVKLMRYSSSDSSWSEMKENPGFIPLENISTRHLNANITPDITKSSSQVASGHQTNQVASIKDKLASLSVNNNYVLWGFIIFIVILVVLLVIYLYNKNRKNKQIQLAQVELQ